MTVLVEWLPEILAAVVSFLIIVWLRRTGRLEFGSLSGGRQLNFVAVLLFVALWLLAQQLIALALGAVLKPDPCEGCGPPIGPVPLTLEELGSLQATGVKTTELVEPDCLGLYCLICPETSEAKRVEVVPAEAVTSAVAPLERVCGSSPAAED